MTMKFIDKGKTYIFKNVVKLQTFDGDTTIGYYIDDVYHEETNDTPEEISICDIGDSAISLGFTYKLPSSYWKDPYLSSNKKRKNKEN